MGIFIVELCVMLCVGGFQTAATKAGSAHCLCTRWMPGKMPTPTCSPRRRPATCTRYNVGTHIIYSLINQGFSVRGLRGHVLGTILADAQHCHDMDSALARCLSVSLSLPLSLHKSSCLFLSGLTRNQRHWSHSGGSYNI